MNGRLHFIRPGAHQGAHRLTRTNHGTGLRLCAHNQTFERCAHREFVQTCFVRANVVVPRDDAAAGQIQPFPVRGWLGHVWQHGLHIKVLHIRHPHLGLRGEIHLDVRQGAGQLLQPLAALGHQRRTQFGVVQTKHRLVRAVTNPFSEFLASNRKHPVDLAQHRHAVQGLDPAFHMHTWRQSVHLRCHRFDQSRTCDARFHGGCALHSNQGIHDHHTEGQNGQSGEGAEQRFLHGSEALDRFQKFDARYVQTSHAIRHQRPRYRHKVYEWRYERICMDHQNRQKPKLLNTPPPHPSLRLPTLDT